MKKKTLPNSAKDIGFSLPAKVINASLKIVPLTSNLIMEMVKMSPNDIPFGIAISKC